MRSTTREIRRTRLSFAVSLALASLVAGNMALAQACFSEVALHLARRHGEAALVMGCTEIPLGLQGSAAVDGLRLVDPARVLASALADRAYGETSSLVAHTP